MTDTETYFTLLTLLNENFISWLVWVKSDWLGLLVEVFVWIDGWRFGMVGWMKAWFRWMVECLVWFGLKTGLLGWRRFRNGGVGLIWRLVGWWLAELRRYKYWRFGLVEDWLAESKKVEKLTAWFKCKVEGLVWFGLVWFGWKTGRLSRRRFKYWRFGLIWRLVSWVEEGTNTEGLVWFEDWLAELKKVQILKVWFDVWLKVRVWFEDWLVELKKVQILKLWLDVWLKVWFDLKTGWLCWRRYKYWSLVWFEDWLVELKKVYKLNVGCMTEGLV